MNPKLLFAALLFLFVINTPAEARVTRVEITSRTDVLDGKSFGTVGAYEKIIGKVYFSVRPENKHNAVIVDLGKAARNESGEVEFSADIYILKPKDIARSSGSLLIEIPNRGGKGILRIVNRASSGSLDPTNETDFGDGFLMRQGWTICWIGWQFDVRDEAGLMRLYAPIARNGREAITGLVRSDFMPTEKVDEFPLGHVINGQIGGTEYPVSNIDDKANVLTVRDSPLGVRKVIPRREWSFAHTENGKLTPHNRSISLKGDFEPGKIYELVYHAKDPVVVGLGLAAVRDLGSYFKHAPDAVASAQRAYALGISQSGRFLRHFLWQGFNADEENRQVFDGMFIHVAGAGIGSFNHRFAQPSRDAQPITALFYPTDLFPFADSPQTDPQTRKRAGLLDRARAENVLPKIFYTNTSYEYWSRSASLIHTSPDGTRDLPLMDNVRVYLYSGLQHFSGPFPPARSTNAALPGVHPQSPLPVAWLWRAMLVNMDEWARNSTPPPPSSYPRLGDGTLASLECLAFPTISSVTLPRNIHKAYRMDYGALWSKGIITKEPPIVGTPFPSFVPQVDTDGNERAGIRLPELTVPLATYTGWNLRAPEAKMAGERVSFLGSYFPFAKRKADRTRTADKRLSVEERYTSREQYLKLYNAAAQKLVGQRFLLREDLADVMQRGGQEWGEAMK